MGMRTAKFTSSMWEAHACLLIWEKNSSHFEKVMFLIQYEHCCGFISTMCCFCSTYPAFSSNLTRHAWPNADTSIRPDGARTQTWITTKPLSSPEKKHVQEDKWKLHRDIVGTHSWRRTKGRPGIFAGYPQSVHKERTHIRLGGTHA